jgi:hypothetical protein
LAPSPISAIDISKKTWGWASVPRRKRRRPILCRRTRKSHRREVTTTFTTTKPGHEETGVRAANTKERGRRYGVRFRLVSRLYLQFIRASDFSVQLNRRLFPAALFELLRDAVAGMSLQRVVLRFVAVKISRENFALKIVTGRHCGHD